MFDNIQMQTMACAELLKDIHFITFHIETIYVSMERKEVLTIVDLTKLSNAYVDQQTLLNIDNSIMKYSYHPIVKK